MRYPTCGFREKSIRQAAGPAVTLSAPGAINPTFTAPPVADGSSETLVFELTVTDSGPLQATDAIEIQVNGATPLPVDPPVVNSPVIDPPVVHPPDADSDGDDDHDWDRGDDDDDDDEDEDEDDDDHDRDRRIRHHRGDRDHEDDDD